MRHLKTSLAVLGGATIATVTWTAPTSQPVRITAIPLAGVTDKGVLTAAKTTARSSAK